MAKNKKKINKGIILIKKSNNLVESKYKFDIWETRFFLSVLAQIRREDTDTQMYRIRYKDIIKIFSLKSGDSYAFLRDAARALMSKSVQINYEENGVERVREVHLIGTIDYLKEGHKKLLDMGNHEYIDVTIQQEMRPFLLQLSKNFTAYDLRNITKLSVYSIRLYELLKQYETFGVRILSIDEMKAMFQVEEQYALYADFYRWVIKPSETEINKHTDLAIIEIEKLKDGRKVVALRFKFRAKTTQELTKLHGSPLQETLFDSSPEPQISVISENISKPLEEDVVSKIIADKRKKTVKWGGVKETPTEATTTDSQAQDKLILQLSPLVVTKFGVGFKVFIDLIERYTEGEIRQAIQVTEAALQTKKIDNIAGFFVEAVRGKYTDVKQEKKQVQLIQKVKVAEAEKVEIDAEAKIRAQKQRAYQQEMAIFMQLIQEDDRLVQDMISKIRLGSLGNYYKKDKSFEENLKHPLLQVAFLSAVKDARPARFDV